MANDPRAIQQELPEIIQKLRRPTGDDPRFATVEGIQAHVRAFLPEVHGTWKRIHERTLEELLNIELLLASPGAVNLPAEFLGYLRYAMAVWRRLNDARVWAIFGQQGHIIRRLCQRKPRPRLLEANPTSIRACLDELNDDPFTFAIWSDATSCVDVGDIITISQGTTRILEVKEGIVNERILEIVHCKGDILSLIHI